MRLRILAALSAALLGTALAPAAAFAAPDIGVPLKGTMWTTMAPATPGDCVIGDQQGDLLTIVENAQFTNSTLTHLGLVTLVQHQCVVADPTEIQMPWGVPGAGLIQVLDATITAANGDTLTLTSPAVPFETFTPEGIDPADGPLPIAFAGTLEITGGTGRFASAEGAAAFEGMYCFRVNGGVYTLSGRLSR
jgi:hypothetical protein